MTAQLPEDAWGWWRSKLAGEDTSQNESNPHAGFYRRIRRNSYGALKFAEPVAYWPGENGELNCRIGLENVTPQRGRDIWIEVCRTPVDEIWYREVTEHEPPQDEWRDGIPLRPDIGDNEPPEGIPVIELLRDKIEAKAKTATERLAGEPVADDAEASRIAILADELQALWKQADETRKSERKVHDQALKEIQIKWAPLLMAAEVYKNLKFKLLTPWVNKLEAENKRQAEEAAAAVAFDGAPVPETPKPKRAKITTRGRAMSLRATKRAEIEDYKICLEFFADSPEVRGCIQDLANRNVRAGVKVPGCKVIEEGQVV